MSFTRYFASTISLSDLNTRTLRPFSSALKPTRAPFCVAGLKISTFDTCKGASRSMIPPCTPICGFGRWCFLDMLSPSTRTRSSASTSMTAPLRPLSRPVIRTTRSPLRIFFIYPFLNKSRPELQYFRRERDDLHELHIAQLASHGPEDTGADRLELVGQQHSRIGVETNQRTIGAAHAALGAYHDGIIDLALFHFAAPNGVLDAHFDDVADGGVTALRAAQDLDPHAALGAAVIGHVQYGSHLNHVGSLFGAAGLDNAPSTPRFSTGIGPDGFVATRGPSLALIFPV